MNTNVITTGFYLVVIYAKMTANFVVAVLKFYAGLQ